MTSAGFVCIPRQALLAFRPRKGADHMAEIGAFVWLVASAAFADHHGVRRGELRTSVSKLAEEWGWSRSRVGRFLQQLQKAGQLVIVNEGKPGQIAGRNMGQGETLYRIAEYDLIVGAPEDRGTARGTEPETVVGQLAVEAGTPIGREQGTENKVNKGKDKTSLRSARAAAREVRSEREREIEAAFAEAWAAYPERVGGNSRKAALTQFRARVLAGAEPRDLVAGTRRYAAFCANDPERSRGEFVLMGSTFYGPQERYEEPWTIPPKRPTASAVGSNGSGRVTREELDRMRAEETYRNAITATEGF